MTDIIVPAARPRLPLTRTRASVTEIDALVQVAEADICEPPADVPGRDDRQPEDLARIAVLSGLLGQLTTEF